MARAKMNYKGSGFKIGVPARDLSAEEVKRFGREYLLSLGLYEDAHQPPKDKPRIVDKNYEPIKAKEDEEA